MFSHYLLFLFQMLFTVNVVEGVAWCCFLITHRMCMWIEYIKGQMGPLLNFVRGSV